MVGHDRERDISPRPYRLFSNFLGKNQCVVGRRFSRCPPFREGVEAETLFCANTSTARVGQVGASTGWADLTPVLEAGDG